jgi:hypothetical protein
MQTSQRHRHKRPFQPAITSYFNRYDDDLDSDSDIELQPRGLSPSARLRTQHHHKQQRESLAPQVPGHVQADLLQVGMRVRKSVPEGYKTHSSKMSGLPSIQTTLSKPPTTTITAVGVERDPVPDAVLHQRELLPFCGLHKIGGYAEQPTTNIHLYAGIDASTGRRPANMFPLPAEAFTQPFSSQDSGYGSDILRSNPTKRSWRDEDERGLDLSGSNFFFALPMKGSVQIDEVPVSPLSETPEELPRVRRLKEPKSRRPAASRGISGTSEVEDVDMDVGVAGDFEDAEFLGGEVAMGGV